MKQHWFSNSFSMNNYDVDANLIHSGDTSGTQNSLKNNWFLVGGPHISLKHNGFLIGGPQTSF